MLPEELEASKDAMLNFQISVGNITAIKVDDDKIYQN
jgi:hypothetical protein